MCKLSPEQTARANKSHTCILQALDKTGQQNAALVLECDPSKVSKAKDDLGWFCQVLAVCGLKVVPTEFKALDRDFVNAIDRDFVNAMLVMNQKLINRVHDVDDLAHDEMSRLDDINF